jgi:hypothetical protein
MTSRGRTLVCGSSSPSSRYSASALGAGHDDGVQGGVVVGGGRQRGHAAPAVVVAAVEGGVDGAVGNHEAQPVDRGDLAAAPAGRQLQGGVVVDDPRVGGDQRLRADVVAGDVLQSRPLARGDGLIDQRGVADVARLRDQDGADAGLQLRQAGARFVPVGEAVEESGLGGDLQQLVGQVGVGEAPVDLLAQREQAGRFGQCIELRDGEASGGELV